MCVYMKSERTVIISCSTFLLNTWIPNPTADSICQVGRGLNKYFETMFRLEIDNFR